jgi:integrase/recombinase XerD
MFAKTYMKKVGNIMELADIMGHSNIEITRIYTLTSADEKRKVMD